MKQVDFHAKKRAKATFMEAMCFRGASSYEPLLEGFTRAFSAKKFMEARETAGRGLDALVRSSFARLNEGGAERWGYTRSHSLEVAGFMFIMASEAKRNGVGGHGVPEPELAFAGGLVHDVGKTFLPVYLLAKELGVNVLGLSLFRDAQLSDVERRILRKEHLSLGCEFVRLFGGSNDEQNKFVLDMVGLHHVMYDGMDSGVPSYPSMIVGMRLPFHARAGKVADFMSAVKPRHYRTNGYITSVDHALAYGIASAGSELDPEGLACFMTGFYKTDFEGATALIRRLQHPRGHEGLDDIHAGRVYALHAVREDEGFRRLISEPDTEKQAGYEALIARCAKSFGVNAGDVWSS
jgi:HD-GYP domain-containing protein (c-di-GMP phosphodiesterase class II)